MHNMNVTSNVNINARARDFFFPSFSALPPLFLPPDCKRAETGPCHFCTSRQRTRDTAGVKYLHLL